MLKRLVGPGAQALAHVQHQRSCLQHAEIVRMPSHINTAFEAHTATACYQFQLQDRSAAIILCGIASDLNTSNLKQLKTSVEGVSAGKQGL